MRVDRRRYPSCASDAVVSDLVDIRELGETNASAVPAVDMAMVNERENFIVSVSMGRYPLS